MKISEILTQLGEKDKSGQFGAVSPPIYQTSNFTFDSVEDFSKAVNDEQHIPIYTRGNNPTVRLLEQKLAALQGTEDALMFSSGSAACSAAITNLIKAGDHVVCVDNAYAWTYKLLTITLSRFGVETTFVDGSEIDDFEAACQDNTTLIVLESPSSLHFQLQNIAAIIPWAKAKGYNVVVDNSYGTPMNQLPATLGADFICHSTTKFVGGHSDVVSGVACGSKELISRLFIDEYMTFGASLSPMEGWLLIRSLRTLPMRIERSGNSANEVSAFLHDHIAVKRIMDPFHPSHPQHELALTQFDRRIPMFSFEFLSEDHALIREAVNRLNVFQIGVSWGGHESLVMPLVAFDDPRKPQGICRLYIGLEDASSLIEDLDNALSVFA